MAEKLMSSLRRDKTVTIHFNVYDSDLQKNFDFCNIRTIRKKESPQNEKEHNSYQAKLKGLSTRRRDKRHFRL